MLRAYTSSGNAVLNMLIWRQQIGQAVSGRASVACKT